MFIVIQRSKATKNLENINVDVHEILPPFGRLNDILILNYGSSIISHPGDFG